MDTCLLYNVRTLDVNLTEQRLRIHVQQNTIAWKTTPRLNRRFSGLMSGNLEDGDERTAEEDSPTAANVPDDVFRSESVNL